MNKTARIKLFTDAEEANAFIATVELAAPLEYKDDKVVVIYRPDLSTTELEKLEYQGRLKMTRENLVQQRAHMEFLGVTKLSEEMGGEDKIAKAKANTELEISNLEAQLKLYEAKLS